jgi:hypothetical protein
MLLIPSMRNDKAPNSATATIDGELVIVFVLELGHAEGWPDRQHQKSLVGLMN